MEHHGLATPSHKALFYKPMVLQDIPYYMPNMNCKTFIRRFDSDRRLLRINKLRAACWLPVVVCITNVSVQPRALLESASWVPCNRWSAQL